MRRTLLGVLAICFTLAATAQQDSTRESRVLRPLPSRSKDHLMIQLGAALWNNRPDSIDTKGLSRTFNMYLMLDFPFRTNPHFSVALGPGIATDHVFLNETAANVAGTTTNVFFDNRSDTTHFKKYKVATAFLEAPIELRFSSNPEADGKSFKVALGVKIGTMLAAWSKGKELQNSGDNTVNNFIEKQKSKRYFNTTRISGMGRIGYGHFSLFGTYSFTSLFKEGIGPDINPVSIGLTISGL